MLTSKPFDWPVPTLRRAPVPRAASSSGRGGPGRPQPRRLLAILARWVDRLATARAVEGLDEHLRRDIGLPATARRDGRARLARLRCVAHGGQPAPFGRD